MKIDIITRHSVPNYGSLLQSYATQKAIEELGHESEIINYTRYDERYENLATTKKKKKKWNNNFILRLIYKMIQTPNYKKMYKKFEQYRNGFLKETENEYGSLEELKKNPPIADVYCSGSDQIWGKIGKSEYDKAYFLEFVENKKCIAYASSFGKTDLNENLNKNLNNLLRKYNKILVRENTAKDLLLAKNINNVEQVLDPTLLLDRKQWDKIADKASKKVNYDYVLVYQLHYNKEFEKYAKEMAKRKKIKLIRISPAIHQITRPGKFIYLPTQYEFVNYFKNAKYILTDSFHATVLAIIFNKKFIDILPSNKTGTRIESILQLFEINNRILKQYDNYKIIDEIIDYEKVNNIILEERLKSLDLLKDAIEN